MKYNLVLTIDTKNPDKFFQIVKSEEGRKDRSEIKVRKAEQKVIFNISAGDPVAMKASVNLILKILTIYEKTENLVKNGCG